VLGRGKHLHSCADPILKHSRAVVCHGHCCLQNLHSRSAERLVMHPLHPSLKQHAHHRNAQNPHRCTSSSKLQSGTTSWPFLAKLNTTLPFSAILPPPLSRALRTWEAERLTLSVRHSTIYPVAAGPYASYMICTKQKKILLGPEPASSH